MSQGSSDSPQREWPPKDPFSTEPPPERRAAAALAAGLRSTAPRPPTWPTEPLTGAETEDGTGDENHGTPPRDNAERLFGAAPPKVGSGSKTTGRGIAAALKTLLRERRRLLLSVVAVSLGIAYLAGALSLLNRVNDGLALQAGATGERADLVIQGVVASSSPFQEVRRLVSNAMLGEVASAPGVAAAEPRLESQSAVIFSSGGERIVGLGLTERPMGANFPADEAMNPYRFVGDGSAPDAPDEVAIDSRTAQAGSIVVGQNIEIATNSTISSFRVTGVVEPVAGALPAGSSLALFDEVTARTLFNLGSDNNAIAVRLEPGADLDEVQQRLDVIAGGAAEVVTGGQYADNRRSTFESSFLLIRALLVGFAGLALVVGSFTVANTMSLLFEHRRRGFAMLRLMGASPSQLSGAAVIEAIIGGVIAGAVGLVLGLGVGLGVERAINATGTAIPTAGPLMTWSIPVIALVVGMLVTVGTALSPAREAARTPPVVAVSGNDPRGANSRRGSTLISMVRTVVVAALAGFALGSLLGGIAIGAVVAGIAVALAIALVLLPRLLGRLVAITTSGLLGSSMALKRMSALRSQQARTRAASTTSALLLATTIVAGLAIIASSFMASVEGEITETVTADLVIDSQTFTNGGFDPELIPAIRAVPGVSAATAWSVGSAVIGSSRYRIGGVDGAALLQTLDLRFRDGTPTSFTPLDFVASSTLADRENYTVGQTATVSLDGGPPLQLNLIGIYDSSLSTLIGDALIDYDALRAAVKRSENILGFVRFSDDAPSTVEADVRAVAEQFKAPAVLKPDELIAERANYLSGFAKVIQWMLAFSIVLALVGVANTLQLGVNERRREIGLLRAVGATQRQVMRLVMTEAAALSLVGSVVGSVLGIGAASAAVAALRQFGMTSLVIPVVTIVFITVAALILSMACAVFPALAAVRIPPLEAIAETEQRGPQRRRAAGVATATAAPGAAGATAGATSEATAAPEPVEPAATEASAPPPTAPTSPEDHERENATVIPQPPAAAGEPAYQGVDSVRCYLCGTDPGGASSCPACGAELDPTTTGVGDGRSLQREPASTPPPFAPAFMPVTAGTDITDAEIVDEQTPWNLPDDGGFPTEADSTALFGATPAELDDAPSSPEHPAPRSSAKLGARTADAAERTAPLFGAQASEPSTSLEASTAPFDATPFDSETSDGRPSDAQPSDAQRPTEPQQQGRDDDVLEAESIDDMFEAPSSAMFSAGSDAPASAPPITPAPSSTLGGGASAVPPAYSRSRSNQRSGAPTVARPSSTADSAERSNVDVNPLDPHGIASAVGRLGAESRIAGSVSFAVAGALLEPGEQVDAILVGRALGLVTILVATDSRVVTISENGVTPEIERFVLSEVAQIHDRTANGQASVTVVGPYSVVTVDQISEVELAEQVAESLRDRLNS